MVSARMLHFVLKIGDRGANINFFRNILGMKVSRHEEFTEGCVATCNGNDFNGIKIQAAGIIDRAKKENYPFSVEDKNNYILRSPDGYTFYITDEKQPSDDPVQGIVFNTNDLQKTQAYWTDMLTMKLVKQTEDEVCLTYSGNQAKLFYRKTADPIDRKTAYGRIAFAIPFNEQTTFAAEIEKRKAKIVHPLTSLDTPGKATVRVIILSDPAGLEICFVDDEAFTELSQFDPKSEEALDNDIKEDPFQKK